MPSRTQPVGSTARTRYPGESRAASITKPTLSPGELLGYVLDSATRLAWTAEAPGYELIRTIGEVQVRAYAPRVVAEVFVPGTADRAGREAFAVLQGYLFGRNLQERKFAMTAPVMRSATPRLAAAASPEHPLAAAGTYVQFGLPQAVTLQSAPEPLDSRVRLRELRGGRIAAIRYSGRWSAANDTEHLWLLEATLSAARLRWAGEPVFARYNPPWTPWFLRRNEVWLALAATTALPSAAPAR
jgi:hypothetical protein